MESVCTKCYNNSKKTTRGEWMRKLNGMKRFLLVSAVGICGCSASTLKDDAQENLSDIEDSIELVFVFAEGDEGAKQTMMDVVTQFNETYKNINVVVRSGGSGSYDELLKVLESTGEFPDILETADLSACVRAGLLEELPADIKELFLTTVDYQGMLYAAPQADNNTLGIIYNKQYFEENGLSEPTTYEEFFSLCEQIKQKGELSPLVVGGQDLWHLGFWFQKAYQDQVLSQDEDFIAHCYEQKAHFTDDCFKNVINELKQIFQYAQNEWPTTSDTQVIDYLLNNRAAMVYSGGHVIADLEARDSNFEIGWFSIPSPDGELRLVGGPTANGIGISKNAASNPEKKKAAETFIRFFFQKDIYQQYCEARGIVPTTVDAPMIEMTSIEQEVQADLAVSDWIGPYWNNEIGEKELPADFRNLTYQIIYEVLLEQKSCDEACIEIEQNWQKSSLHFNPVTDNN